MIFGRATFLESSLKKPASQGKVDSIRKSKSDLKEIKTSDRGEDISVKVRELITLFLNPLTARATQILLTRSELSDSFDNQHAGWLILFCIDFPNNYSSESEELVKKLEGDIISKFSGIADEQIFYQLITYELVKYLSTACKIILSYCENAVIRRYLERMSYMAQRELEYVTYVKNEKEEINVYRSYVYSKAINGCDTRVLPVQPTTIRKRKVAFLSEITSEHKVQVEEKQMSVAMSNNPESSPLLLISLLTQERTPKQLIDRGYNQEIVIRK